MTPRSTPPTAGPDLSPAAVAEQIGVTKATVLELIANGRLPAYRIGQRVLRVRREDLDRFRAGNTQTVGATAEAMPASHADYARGWIDARAAYRDAR